MTATDALAMNPTARMVLHSSLHQSRKPYLFCPTCRDIFGEMEPTVEELDEWRQNSVKLGELWCYRCKRGVVPLRRLAPCPFCEEGRR